MTTKPNNDFLERKLKEFSKYYIGSSQKRIKEWITEYHNELIDEIVEMGEEIRPIGDRKKTTIYSQISHQTITDYQKKIQSLKHKGNGK